MSGSSGRGGEPIIRDKSNHKIRWYVYTWRQRGIKAG